MRRAVPTFIALICLLAPAVAGASARGGKKVLEECANNGVIANPGSYTNSDYQYALKHIASDLAEYTSCEDEIRRARAAAESNRRGGVLGAGLGSGGGGGALGDLSTPSAQEKAAIENAAGRAESVRVGGKPVSPGGGGLTASSVTHSLPNAMLLVLILIAVAVLARVAATIRSHVIARRQA